MNEVKVVKDLLFELGKLKAEIEFEAWKQSINDDFKNQAKQMHDEFESEKAQNESDFEAIAKQMTARFESEKSQNEADFRDWTNKIHNEFVS